MLRIITSKVVETWFAQLQYQKESLIMEDSFCWETKESVESKSYSGLQVEIGNKGWVDQVNKNH